MKIFVDIIGSILQVILINYFFGKVLVKKNLGIKTEYIIDSFFILIFSGITIMLLKNVFATLMYFATLFMFAIVKYKDKFGKKVLWAIFFYIMNFLSEMFVGLSISKLFSVNLSNTHENAIFHLQGTILSVLFLYTILRAIGFFRLKSDIQLDFKSIIAIIIIPISSILSCYYIAVIAFKIDDKVFTLGVIITMVFIFLSNISIFYLLEKQSKLYKAEQELLNIQTQYKLQAEYYLELKDNMLISNQQIHNVKSFIAAVNNYLEKNQIDFAQNRISEYLQSIPILRDINTGNDAVNALLYHKMGNIEKVKNNNISVLLPQILNIDEIDLCIIIGNAIDNCLEACAKIEDAQKQFVNIKIFPYSNQLSLLFENSYNGDTKSMTLKTTKEQKFLHGFGTKTMKSLCEKYNGSIVFNQSKDKFTVSILLPNLPFEQK